MADALSIIASSMAQDQQRLATISHNLANATTPAFRRELSTSRPFVAWVDGLAAPAPLPQSKGVLDLRPGTLRATGSALDLALTSDAWFEVLTPAGTAYTRRGDFAMDARGRLVTHEGHPVMGNAGEIVLGSGTVRIDAQGRVFEDQRAAGQLRLVRFEDPRLLAGHGAGLFMADAGAALPADSPGVRQGFLENANVQSAAEMVRLIETLRRFESGQKVVQNIDDMLGRAIRSLGEY